MKLNKPMKLNEFVKLNESIRIILEGERKKYRVIDDFMSFYSRQINSAFDMWMRLPQIRSLYKLYNAGADIKSETFSDYSDNDNNVEQAADRKINLWLKKMKADGYHEFDRYEDREVNMLEIIVVKK